MLSRRQLMCAAGAAIAAPAVARHFQISPLTNRTYFDYSDTNIQAVLGGNFQRLLTASWGG